MIPDLDPLSFEPTHLPHLMQEEGCELFLNTQLEPTIRIPEDGFQTEWPVDSQRIRDFLNSLFFEHSEGEKLNKSDRDFVMSLLREECRKGGRRMSESEVEKSENDPIIQACLFFFNHNERFEGRLSDFLHALQLIQKKGHISSQKELSPFRNIFSRQLKRLTPTLVGFGIQVEISHKESGSHCSIKRLDNFVSEPSPRTDDDSNSSSAISSLFPNGLHAADGTDGAIRIDPPQLD